MRSAHRFPEHQNDGTTKTTKTLTRAPWLTAFSYAPAICYCAHRNGISKSLEQLRRSSSGEALCRVTHTTLRRSRTALGPLARLRPPDSATAADREAGLTTSAGPAKTTVLHNCVNELRLDRIAVEGCGVTASYGIQAACRLWTRMEPGRLMIKLLKHEPASGFVKLVNPLMQRAYRPRQLAPDAHICR